VLTPLPVNVYGPYLTIMRFASGRILGVKVRTEAILACGSASLMPTSGSFPFKPARIPDKGPSKDNGFGSSLG
jgi:hypothetical protein